jgi:hypothetical protein
MGYIPAANNEPSGIGERQTCLPAGRQKPKTQMGNCGLRIYDFGCMIWDGPRTIGKCTKTPQG